MIFLEETLETAHILVQPGRSLDPLPPQDPAEHPDYVRCFPLAAEKRALLERYEQYALDEITRTRDALIILCDCSEKGMQTQEYISVLKMLDRLRPALRDRLHILFGCGQVGNEDCDKYMQWIRTSLGTVNMSIAKDTTVVCLGESATISVPTIATHVGEAFGTKVIVPLQHTNARLSDRRDGYRAGGQHLLDLQKKYPRPVFLAIPDERL